MGNALRKEVNEGVTPKPERKWLRLPHVYVILVLMLILAYVATLLVPKGQFERVEGPTGAALIVPNTFQYIEQPNLTGFDLMFSIPTGMVQASEIIFGGLMIGALFVVLERTGLLSLVLQKVIATFSKKRIFVIPAMMLPMAVFTTFTGAMELALIYVPIMIPLILKMGYDRFTATAMVLVSTSAGFSVALTAPATVGLAQRLSDLPLYSGIEYRAVILAVVVAIGVWYVWKYARKIERDATLGFLYGDGLDAQYINDEEEVITKVSKRNMIAIAFLATGMGIMIYGLLNWGWYFIEIGGWYAFMSIVLGFICGMNASSIAEAFNEGFKKMIVAVVVIGLSRSISVVLQEGNILDTIVHGISEVVSGMPTALTAIVMMVVQGLFNFLVGSGSGQAMITMPIMTGLSDLLGVSRQTAVLAFQFGDGFTNLIYPVSLVLAILAMAQIPFTKWLRFITPLLFLWLTVAAISLIIVEFIGW
ncbi:YfcC family protein [Alkalihalobacillus deserti]|uniref:YfcC family protein n=1 Tax=Alkalihalobacillus deserti TaxID=2879466 RepID=UPI001D132F4C|nr:Na+/H+ antiporter NhaC family protein [Alkalihalobacillus deserti]